MMLKGFESLLAEAPLCKNIVDIYERGNRVNSEPATNSSADPTGWKEGMGRAIWGGSSGARPWRQIVAI